MSGTETTSNLLFTLNQVKDATDSEYAAKKLRWTHYWTSMSASYLKAATWLVTISWKHTGSNIWSHLASEFCGFVVLLMKKPERISVAIQYQFWKYHASCHPTSWRETTGSEILSSGGCHLRSRWWQHWINFDRNRCQRRTWRKQCAGEFEDRRSQY